MANSSIDIPVGPQPIDWEQLLLVYLHDPIDKALDIRGHEYRAARYAACALGRKTDRGEVKSISALSDRLAAIAERIPMPTAGSAGERAVGPQDGQIEIRHPMSADAEFLDHLVVDEDAVLAVISEIVKGLEDPRQRFLALWRLLPERLGGRMARLPADTRIPDHSLIQHADISSGMWTSRTGAHDGAYLSLSIGPVQPFIEAARTVRDLWSGSAILSWLVFQGLLPILDRFGPTALVFPALRGNPMMDIWLRRDSRLADRIPKPEPLARRSPSLPNRFVALVPWGEDGRDGFAMRDQCIASVHSAWRRLSDDVLRVLDRSLASVSPDWGHRWHRQTAEFFEVRASILPERPLDDPTLANLIGGRGRFEELWPDAARVRRLATAIPASHRPRYDQESAGRWQAHLEVSARLMEAQRSIRHLPKGDEETPSPAKCSLLGTFEQMGPSGLEESRRFWENARNSAIVDGVRLRSEERLSAVALCKRFAAPALLRRELDLDIPDIRFPDTATVAASAWLNNVDLDYRGIENWSGRWLHQASRTAVDDGEKPPPHHVWERMRKAAEDVRPPSYFAILMMDADHMGRWLNGEKAPALREVMHPKMIRYFENLGEATRPGLEAQRPVGPALHSSISEALNNFASNVAAPVVDRYLGTLIYSGGDDLLALLPVRNAVQCAQELQERFRGIEQDRLEGQEHRFLTMGRKATLSAGIAFVHMKEDLRIGLQSVRRAESAAKEEGRNVLALRFMRRSGEHANAVIAWDLSSWFQELVQMFAEGVTDRWTYRLRAELPTLAGSIVPMDAIGAEIRRLVNRASDGASAQSAGLTGGRVEEWWEGYVESELRRRPNRAIGEILESFVKICQGASFLSRGYDD